MADANIIIILSALCLLFLSLSAFFSASETALFSIPRERIDTFQTHEAHSHRLIYALLIDGQRTLLLLLLGNIFVNITLTGLINSLVITILGRSATLWSFVAATTAIILFGEVLPKNGALRRNEAVAAAAAPILYVFKALSSPLLDLIQTATRFFLKIFKLHLRRPSPFITIDELKSAISNSLQKGVISKQEQGVIINLLDRGAQPVTRFMIHRSQAPLLPHYATAANALKELARLKQNFALITRGENNFQVSGIVTLPDLLSAPSNERCRHIAKPAHWAPSTLETADLVSFMFAEKLSVVCILDEFGGLFGAFSLSDSLNHIMNFKPERSASDKYGCVFSGLQEIDGMAEWLPQSLTTGAEHARTLNGLLTRHLGRIPKTGESIDIDGKKFYIISSEVNKIVSVLIRKTRTG